MNVSQDAVNADGVRFEPCPVHISSAALEHLVRLRSEDGREGVGLMVEAVIVTDEEGDAVYEYSLGFEPVLQAGLDVSVFTVGSLHVLVPTVSLAALRGARIDVGGPSGLTLCNPNRPARGVPDGLVADDRFADDVRRVLADKVNPMLDVHGGGVELVGHDGAGSVVLRMFGGCQGCALSKVTMFDGVTSILKEHLGGVVSVLDVTDHASGTNPYYQLGS